VSWRALKIGQYSSDHKTLPPSMARGAAINLSLIAVYMLKCEDDPWLSPTDDVICSPSPTNKTNGLECVGVPTVVRSILQGVSQGWSQER
jgi:hypothetical protein